MAAACFSKMARWAPERKVKLLPPPHRPPVLRLLRWVAGVQGDWLGWRQGRGGLLRWVAGVQGGWEVLARRLVVEEGG